MKMLAAAELFAVEPVLVQTGRFVEISLWLRGELLPKSLGRAEYHIVTLLAPGSRLAATGRLYVCQLELADLGMGATEAMPPVPVGIKERADNIVVLVRTNLFLTPEDFRTQAQVTISLGESTHDGDYTIISPKPGVFQLEVK